MTVDRSKLLATKPTLEELRAFLAAAFPQSAMELLATDDGTARARLAIDDSHLRPGGTVSGPSMMALADAVTYMALLSRIGIVPLAVTSSLNIAFLRRPKAHRAIVAEATLLKAGRKLAVAEVRIVSEGDDALVAHATVTYAIPG
ncbi:PaaI family thioesterase [soil metagenome]